MDCDQLAQRKLDAVQKHKALTLLPQEAEQWLVEGGSIAADSAVYHKRLIDGLLEDGVLGDQDVAVDTRRRSVRCVPRVTELKDVETSHADDAETFLAPP